MRYLYYCIFFSQVAVKNNVDIFYFATVMGIHIFFCEDGAMDKRIFLSTWKDIPSQNEVQFNIDNINMNAGKVNIYIYIYMYIQLGE